MCFVGQGEGVDFAAEALDHLHPLPSTPFVQIQLEQLELEN